MSEEAAMGWMGTSWKRHLPAMRLVLVALAIVTSMPGRAVTVAEPGSPARIAVIVANNLYLNSKQRLPGALRDAELMRATLEDKRLGFHVTYIHNANKQILEQAIEDFRAALDRAGPTAIGFFYYAGHGGADLRGNYLIPTDVENVFDVNLAKRGVSVRKMSNILDGLDSRPAIVIVIDACRTPTDGAPVAGRGGASVGGALKFVAPDEPKPGFLMALSASKMSGAPDNGPYAKTLAAKLLTKGLTIDQVFEQVRYEVSKSTRMAQVPVDLAQIVDPVCFVSCAAEPLPSGGPYSQNSVLLNSTMHAADLAVKRLAGMKAESHCVNGWKSILTLRKSAEKALKEGHPDAAGATYVQLQARIDEIQQYLYMVERGEQNRNSQAVYEKERRERDAVRAKKAYDEDNAVLTRFLNRIKETAARMKTSVDTREVDRLKSTAEQLAADGKIEDAGDRLVDALNLAIPMLESERGMAPNKRPYAHRNPGGISSSQEQAQARWAQMLARLSSVCE